MKKFFHVFFVLFVLVVFSCKGSASYSYYDKEFFEDEDKNKSYPDDMIIPDKYNTGVRANIVLSKMTGSGKVGGVYINVKDDTGQYLITSYGENHKEDKNGKVTFEMDDLCIIENYDFSDRPMVCYNGNRFSCKKKILFRNCKFNSFRNPPNEDNKVWFEFDYCTFGGGVNEAQISLNHCYIGGYTADGMNPTRYFKCKNTYVANLMTGVTDKEVHVDGFQIYGRDGINGGHIYFNNVRFEIPGIHIAGQHSGTAVNASVMFQLEFGPVDNCLFKNLYINGGGKWYPVYLTNGKGKKFSQENLVLENAYVSNNFGKIFYTGSYDENATVKNVDHHDSLYVSSVWKDDSGKTHVICSNDTMYKSTLLVKTDKGDFEFEMPRCPSDWNLGGEVNKSKDVNNGKGEDASFLKDEKDKSYINYKFSDMPFDVDCVIAENVSYVKCFDKENNQQIRNVKF